MPELLTNDRRMIADAPTLVLVKSFVTAASASSNKRSGKFAELDVEPISSPRKPPEVAAIAAAPVAPCPSTRLAPELPPARVRLFAAGAVRVGVVTLVRNDGAAALSLRVPLVTPSTAMKSSDAVVVAVVARSLMRMSAIK